MARRPLRLLMVGAHPADTFDQAGGTLCHHVRDGDQVTLLSVSTGVRSHNWQLMDRKAHAGDAMDVEKDVAQAREQKRQELLKAGSFLGLTDVRVLDFDDDEELLTQPMVNAIADVILETRPDVLITHHPLEEWGLKLHASVGRATVFAWRRAHTTGRGKALPPHLAAAIFFMNPMAYVGATLDNTFAARVDILVDISDVIEEKTRAMDAVASQYYNGAYALKIGEADNGHWGYRARVAYAEPFQRHRPWVTDKLPVSDFELEYAGEDHEQRMGRFAGQIKVAHMKLGDERGPT